MSSPKRWNRRSILSGLTTGILLSSAASARSQPTEPASSSDFIWPDPIDIGEQLTILDWRVYPGADGDRLIVELHSDREEAIHSPAVAFRLPSHDSHLTWAVPWEAILHPQSSTLLVARLPDNTLTEDEAGDITGWELCDGVRQVNSETLDAVDAVHIEDLQSEPWTEGRHFWATLVNTSTSTQPARIVTAIVRDTDGRLAGILDVSVVLLSNSEPQSFHTWITRKTENAPLEPTRLLDDPVEMQVEFRIQPRGDAVAPGCPAIMPWNQDD